MKLARRRSRASALPLLALLAGCAEPPRPAKFASPDNRYQLFESISHDTDPFVRRNALDLGPTPPNTTDLIFAIGESSVAPALADAGARRIAVCAPESPALRDALRKGRIHAWAIESEHGRVALDLAVLAALDRPRMASNDLQLGVTIVTPSTLDFGGEAVLGASEQATLDHLEAARDVFALPDDRRVVRIGIALDGVDPARNARMQNELTARARSYARRVEVIFKDARGRTNSQRAHLEELRAEGAAALILLPCDDSLIARPSGDAEPLPTIVIGTSAPLSHVDHVTRLRTDTAALGRALARACGAIVGNGAGRIVEIVAPGRAHVAKSMADALGLAPPQGNATGGK